MNILKILTLLNFVLLAGVLSGCPQTSPGPIVDASGTRCPNGLVQIGVGDGFLEYLCGCTGSPAGGTVLSAPANLTCHVPAGSVVMFQYIAIETEHQIISSSGLTFASGQPIFPGQGIYTTAATFPAVGTYGFEDSFDTALHGQIVVP